MNKMRMTELLDEVEFRFEWIDKKTFGLAYSEDKLVIVNHVLSIADTIVHELIHVDDPEKSEEDVIEETFKTLQRLTISELTELVKHVMGKGGAM